MIDGKTSSHQNAAEFAWQSDDVFGRIAARYDKLSDIFSFGIHRVWKRRVATRIASEKWNTLLDGAVVLETLLCESWLVPQPKGAP